MKKFLALALAIVMAVGCMLAISSCSMFDPKPETNLDDAQRHLENNNYVVIVKESSEDTTLPIGVETVLVAYDLSDFVEEMKEKDEDFDLQEYKDLLGENFADTVVSMIGGDPDLTICVFKDKELANFAYDEHKLEVEAEEAMRKAEEKDAKEYGSDYYSYKEEEKYEEKERELTYEYAKYMLKEFKSELDQKDNADLKEYYESFVEAYERKDDILFGKKDNIFWVGTEQAIRDSQ